MAEKSYSEKQYRVKMRPGVEGTEDLAEFLENIAFVLRTRGELVEYFEAYISHPLVSGQLETASEVKVIWYGRELRS